MEEREGPSPWAPYRCLPAALLALLAVLAATPAAAESPLQAVMQPLPGAEIRYEHLAPHVRTPAPGRFDGALATPAGTLRTSVRVAPEGEYILQPGDTSFELLTPGLPGQVQLNALEAGGTGAQWRAPLGRGLAAETRARWTPGRTGQSLMLRKDLGNGDGAQALVSQSSTESADGSRWDLELRRKAGPMRWILGANAAERSYVSSAGAVEPRAGLRLGTQWPVTPGVRMEMGLTHQQRWEDEGDITALKLGTRLALPLGGKLATGVELDTQARRKASVTITVPLEAP